MPVHFVCQRAGRLLRAEAKQDELSLQERLQLHQAKSGPVMGTLKTRFDRQFDEHRVEPNSGLGQAMQHIRNHREALTLTPSVQRPPRLRGGSLTFNLAAHYRI